MTKLPSIIKQQRERIAKLESELPTLQAIVSRTWGRQDELTALKQECDELKKRIDESLKDNRPEQEEAETDMPPIPAEERLITLPDYNIISDLSLCLVVITGQRVSSV